MMKIMKKITRITVVKYCGVCDYQDYDYENDDKPLCMREDKHIERIDEIPDWCPLEDYEGDPE